MKDRHTTPSGGGLVDKNTKGRRAPQVPLIEPIRDLVRRRIELAGGDSNARLFTGPRGGRITTATLRDATSWDEVVTELSYEHLKRHGLRHTGLTWMADVGVPLQPSARSLGTEASRRRSAICINPRELHQAGEFRLVGK